MEKVQIYLLYNLFLSAVAEGKLYSGFVASGKQTLTIGSKEQAFDLSQENGVTEYGHILSIIDLADGSSSLTKNTPRLMMPMVTIVLLNQCL